jgi:hypothetical protein
MAGAQSRCRESVCCLTLQELEPVVLGVEDSCTLRVMWQTSAACPVDRGCVLGDTDFSSLRRTDYYEVLADSGQKFLLNLCGPVRSGACGNTERATACQVFSNDSVAVIGHLDGHSVKMSDSTGVTLVYKAPRKGAQHMHSVAVLSRLCANSTDSH